MSILDAEASNPFTGGPSFSLSNRLYRAAWGVTWILLASWTPAPLHRWRRFLLRLFGAQVARTAHVYGGVRIWSPANFAIGESASIGNGATIYSMARITIGHFAVISQGVHLCAGTHDVSDPMFQLQARPIRIADHAWVAADAFVGPGVTVGEGAVLGARGCAMRSLDPWTVYSGNPAVPLRARILRGPPPRIDGIPTAASHCGD